MLSKIDDFSIHLQKFLESIPIWELVESENLYRFVEELEILIEKHQN